MGQLEKVSRIVVAEEKLPSPAFDYKVLKLS